MPIKRKVALAIMPTLGRLRTDFALWPSSNTSGCASKELAMIFLGSGQSNTGRQIKSYHANEDLSWRRLLIGSTFREILCKVTASLQSARDCLTESLFRYVKPDLLI